MRPTTLPKTTVFSRLITAGIAVVFLLLAGVLAVGFAAPRTPHRTEFKAAAGTPASLPVTDLATADDTPGEDDDIASVSLPPTCASLPALLVVFLPVGADEPVSIGHFLVTKPLRLHLLLRVLLI